MLRTEPRSRGPAVIGTSQRGVTGDQRPHIIFIQVTPKGESATLFEVPVPRDGGRIFISSVPRRGFGQTHIVEKCAVSTYLR